MRLPGNDLHHLTTVRHEGKVLLFGIDAAATIKYAIRLDVPQAVGTETRYWTDWQVLRLPDDADDLSVLAAQREAQTEAYVRSVYRTQTQTALAPIQALSDGEHLCVFRQSTAGTLYVDRFVLDAEAGTLVRKLEVRFKRSKQKHTPRLDASGQPLDARDFRDPDGNFFFEPTTELRLINNLTNGWFSVVLTPTNEHDRFRWHLFAYNDATDKLELTSLRRSEDGLFDIRDYTVLEGEADRPTPRRIPGIIKRRLDLKNGERNLTPIGRFTATAYALQKRVHDDKGEEYLVKTGQRVLLAVPTNDHGRVAVLTFAVHKDGTLATIDETLPQEVSLLEQSEEILLPTDLLQRVSAGALTQAQTRLLPPDTGLAFNGADDFVELVDVDPGESFTVEMWVHPASLDADQCFIGKHTPTGRSIFSLGCVHGGVAVLIRESQHDLPNTAFAGWHHLAAVVEKTGPARSSVTAYLDGELLWQHSYPAALGNPEGRPWVLGMDWDGSARTDFFAGMMAEVRLWNTALSKDLIQQRMGYRLSGDEPGLVGYWPLDESTLGGVQDHSENGALRDAHPASPTQGYVPPHALTFDGADDYVALANWSPDDMFTVELWVDPVALDDGQCFVSRRGEDGELLFSFGYFENGLQLEIRGEAHTAPVKRTGWQHLAVVVEKKKTQGAADASRVTVYRDGELSFGPVTLAGALGATAGGSWTLGTRESRDGARDFFLGQMADIRFWNAARTQQQIQETMGDRLLGCERDLEGYWPLDALVGDRVLDFAPPGRDGTVHGAQFGSRIFSRLMADRVTEAAAFRHDEVFAATESATYRESIDFILEPLPDDFTFNLVFWGREGGRDGKKTDPVTVRAQIAGPAEIAELDGDWKRATACFTVPEGMTHLRCFEIAPPAIGPSAVPWNTLELRNHTIERLAGTVTQATSIDDVTLTARGAGYADAESQLARLGPLETEEAQLTARLNELDALLKPGGREELEAEIPRLAEEERSLRDERDERKRRWDEAIGSPFNYWCSIQARHSGKELAVLNASLDNDARIIQYDHRDSLNQRFKFEPAGDGYYHIQAQHSAKELAVRNVSKENQAPIVQWRHSDGSNQQFRFEPAEDGCYSIQARHSGKELAVLNARHDNGAPIIQYDHRDGLNQRFRLAPTAERSNSRIADAENEYRIKYEEWRLKSSELTNRRADLNTAREVERAEKTQRREVVQGQIREIRSDYLRALGELNRPQDMPEVARSEQTGLAVRGAVLDFARCAGDLSAMESVGGSVQLSFFDTNARLHTPWFDVVDETWQPDVPGTCLRFGPSPSGAVEVPDHVGLQMSRRFSLETWLCVDEFAPGCMGVLGKAGNGADRNYVLFVNADGSLLFGYDSQSNEFVSVSTQPDTIAVGVWYHVACVFDAETTSMKLYVDGVDRKPDIELGVLKDAIDDEVETHQIELASPLADNVEVLAESRLRVGPAQIVVTRIEVATGVGTSTTTIPVESITMAARKGATVTLLTVVPDGIPKLAGCSLKMGVHPDPEGHPLKGRLDEVRIWNVALTQEEIQAHMHQRLSGKEPGLVGYWPMNEAVGGEVRDHSGNGHHGQIVGATFVPSTAPVGCVPEPIRRLPVVDGAEDPADATAAPQAVVCAEYGTMVPGAVGGQEALMRRLYAYAQPTGVRVLADRRLEALEVRWIGNAQFAPTLLGYIEGPPPIPSENLTEDNDYSGATAVELSVSEDVTFGWARSAVYGLGAEVDLAVGSWVEGAVGYKSGLMGRFRMKTGYDWLEDSKVTSAVSLARCDRLELKGTREKKARFPDLGRRFIPKNVGYAVVVSALADVFVVRLKGSKRMISYEVRPVEDIPPDVNTITFLINPAYTMNGALDGQVGSHPAGERFYGHVPAMRASYGSTHPASYYRLQEAYDLKQKIEAEDKKREADFLNYDSHIIDWGLPEVDSADMGSEGEGAAATGEAGREETEAAMSGYEQGGSSSAASDQQKRMEALLRKVGKRNITNTYVWDGDGGFRAETQEFASTIEQTVGGSFNLDLAAGIAAEFKAFGFGFELEALGTFHMTQTMTKTETRSSGFRLNVDVSCENRNITNHDDTPFFPGEKVDRYRFMSFYLEPKTEHFRHFFDVVVDPEWLRSNDEEARALRQIDQTQPNKTWRLFHRVTYVERPALMGFGTKRTVAAEEPE